MHNAPTHRTRGQHSFKRPEQLGDAHIAARSVVCLSLPLTPTRSVEATRGRGTHDIDDGVLLADGDDFFPPSMSSALDSLISSALVESLLETGLFGVYAVLFITVLYLFRSRDRRPPRVVLAALVAQFVICIAHWINTLYVVIYTLGSMQRDEAGVYLGDMSVWSFGTNVALSQAGALITNLLLIHRLYVVFARDILAVVPALSLWAIQMVSSMGVLYITFRASPGEQFPQIFHLSNPWVTLTLVTSLLLSVYCTGSISWRILSVRRGLKPVNRIESGTSLITVLSTIVESSALQMASTTGLLITFRIRFVGLIVFNGSMPVLLAISTVLIYARIGLGWAYGESKTDRDDSVPIRFVTPTDSTFEVQLDQTAERRRGGEQHPVVSKHDQVTAVPLPTPDSKSGLSDWIPAL
ncbi:hypothetical protein HMN09_00797800 [Mycena chlorophos]|uniref:Uncharacterized protein n=1 Tax=Mycena chlorophos TaxID=658473 RepID=A0A8H6SU02_MYCCL|nr:hypothetical protein HMN09_00797800 [Mycena chlorophos]